MPKNDDDNIWAEYAKVVKRTTHLCNLKSPKHHLIKKRVPKRTFLPEVDIKKELMPPDLILKSGKWMPVDVSKTLVIFDKRMERKLRAGDIGIEAKLDMHGMTQKEAFMALAGFITAQTRAGARNLLVITGKGRGRGKAFCPLSEHEANTMPSEIGMNDGVLKKSLQSWLENLPEAARILALRPAAIKHGGGGAFYVILRRKP